MGHEGMNLFTEVYIGTPSMSTGPVEHQPDLPPNEPASDHREGFKKHGSAGQLWIVRNGQWEKFDNAKGQD